MPEETEMIIRPAVAFDELDLFFNGEVSECLFCSGYGGEYYTDSNGYEHYEECEACNGTGEIGIIIYTPDSPSSPIAISSNLLAVK